MSKINTTDIREAAGRLKVERHEWFKSTLIDTLEEIDALRFQLKSCRGVMNIVEHGSDEQRLTDIKMDFRVGDMISHEDANWLISQCETIEQRTKDECLRLAYDYFCKHQGACGV